MTVARIEGAPFQKSVSRPSERWCDGARVSSISKRMGRSDSTFSLLPCCHFCQPRYALSTRSSYCTSLRHPTRPAHLSTRATPDDRGAWGSVSRFSFLVWELTLDCHWTGQAAAMLRPMHQGIKHGSPLAVFHLLKEKARNQREKTNTWKSLARASQRRPRIAISDQSHGYFRLVLLGKRLAVSGCRLRAVRLLAAVTSGHEVEDTTKADPILLCDTDAVCRLGE